MCVHVCLIFVCFSCLLSVFSFCIDVKKFFNVFCFKIKIAFLRFLNFSNFFITKKTLTNDASWNYRVGQKKLHTAFFAITLPTRNQFSQFLAYINRRKFATGRCIVSQPTTIYVTTLPCEILIATLFMFTYIKQSTYYFGGNNCQFLSNFHEYNF